MKLVAVDIDGTFLRSDMTYDEDRFKKIYPELEKRKIKFVVASGDQYFMLKNLFPNYPDIIYIAENGALIRNPEHLYSLHHYSDEAVKKIIEFLDQQNDANYLISGVESAYVHKKFGDDFYHHMHAWYAHFKQVSDYSEIHDQIIKFNVHCPFEKTQYYVDLFNDKLGKYCQATSSGHGDIDLIIPGIHKANALKELGKKLNIKLADMCAFGDGTNDIEMITEVGDGVAMKNACPELLKISDHVTDSNDDQGVLTYLEKYLAN